MPTVARIRHIGIPICPFSGYLQHVGRATALYADIGQIALSANQPDVS
jgi:hypothetical protein